MKIYNGGKIDKHNAWLREVGRGVCVFFFFSFLIFFWEGGFTLFLSLVLSLQISYMVLWKERGKSESVIINHFPNSKLGMMTGPYFTTFPNATSP